MSENGKYKNVSLLINTHKEIFEHVNNLMEKNVYIYKLNFLDLNILLYYKLVN